MRRPDEAFMDEMASLEDVYLESDDPIRQSGFSGGAARWEQERGAVLAAIDRDGSFLDVGCANGYLLECLVTWAVSKGVELEPHGIDLGPRLIALARRRLPEHAANLHVADAFSWTPGRQFDYVFTLSHLAPPHLVGDLWRRLARWVTPGGRLVVAEYGSRSRRVTPRPMAEVLTALGFTATGSAMGGDPPLSSFAWVDM